MSLRNRVRLIWVALILLWVIIWFRHSDKSGGKWELLSAFLVTIVGITLAGSQELPIWLVVEAEHS